MDKKTITAILLAFMLVRTPVSLGEVQAYASPQVPEANAVSEVNIAENINTVLQKPQILTTEEKAQSQMIAYRQQLEIEAAQIKAENDARIARENADRIAKLQAAGLSSQFVAQYADASAKFGVPWQILAAVHYTETGQRGDTMVTSYAGAQGPMQFMPSTFRAYATDGDGDGQAQIDNVSDAIFTAANYMAANGAANGQVVNALYRYNNDYGYVYHVLGIARSLGYNG
jgi:membrane-bound lytic murein transglycosylase B